MSARLPTQVGRYLVRERIGQGGMGVLYLAVDPLIDRLVAIKLLRVHDEELHQRFVREARSAGGLAHPNIVTIFDVGDHEGQPFIAMEYIPGETFSELIRRRAPLTWLRKVQLVAELCGGLAYAHRAGIVHRDIKPSNIMLSHEEVLKIVDFGIARVVDAGMTQTGAFMGTPNYMSPEQLNGHKVDHRSDIFSVGLVLYEFLTSKQAFTGDSVLAVAQKILTKEPEPLRELDPGLDVALVEVVERALKKDPDARFADAATMRIELLKVARRWADDTTVTSRPPADPTPTPTPTPTPGSRQAADRAMLAKRRATQIEWHLQVAREALAERRYEGAIEACEHAATLDPDEPRAHDLIAQAQAAIDERQSRAWLQEAREEIGRGALTRASQLIAQTLALTPKSAEAHSLEREILSLRHDQEQAAQRQRQIQGALDRARDSLRDGALDSAIRSANEILALEAHHQEGESLKARALALVAHREQQDRDRRAREAIEAARTRFRNGDHDAAIAALRRLDPRDEGVAHALTELQNEAEAIAARARDAERQEAENRRQAEEQRQREVAARELEQARLRQEAERQEQENQRRQQELAQRHKQEEAEAIAARARDAERQEAENRRQAEEQRQREVAARELEQARLRQEAERQEQENQRRQQESEQRRKQEEAEAIAARARDAERQEAENRRQAEEQRQREVAARELEQARLRQEAERQEQENQRRQQESEQRRKQEEERSTEAARPATQQFAQPVAEARREVEEGRTAAKVRGWRPRRSHVIVGGALAASILAAVVLLRPSRSEPGTASTPPPATESQISKPVEPPATTSPLAQAASLSVRINAAPWARVRIVPTEAGRESRVGTTPLVVDLPEGEYTLEFQNDLFKPVTQSLVVRQGQTLAVNVQMPGADIDRIVNDVLGPRP